MKKIRWAALAALACAGLLYGLTVNGSLAVLGTLTARVVDFTGSQATKPVKAGVADPSTCAVGEFFYRTDTGKLRHCPAANTWADVSAAAVASSNLPDPATASVVEEFLGGSTTGGSIGNTGVSNAVFSSGSVSYLDQTGSNAMTDHPGVLALNAAATAGSGAGVWIASTGSAKNINAGDLMTKDWGVTWIAKLPNVADARFRAGMSMTVNLVPTANSSYMSTFIRYDTDAAYADNTRNGGAGTYVAQICGYDSTGCAANDGVAVEMAVAPDTGWHQFKIYRTSATLYFQVDSNAPKTVCASGCNAQLPGSVLWTNKANSPWIAYGVSTATARSLWVDWMGFFMKGISR